MPRLTRAEAAIVRDAKRLTDAAIAKINTNGDKKIDEAELDAAMKAMEKAQEQMGEVQSDTRVSMDPEMKGLMLVFQGLSRMEEAGGAASARAEAEKAVKISDVKKHTNDTVKWLLETVKNPPGDESGPFALMLAAMLLPDSAKPWVLDQIKKHDDN
jgi:hypothetical protein